MPISPWARGQLSPPWTIACMRDNGAVMDLTGVTVGQLSLVIYGNNYTQLETGAGTFTILNANPGVVRYTLAHPDSVNAGTYYVRVSVNFGGTSPDMSDYIQWIIQP